MASLSLKHIFKVYDGGVKAVNDFNMEIDDKEFIVFVGPSGCGKSTTLRMIAGLEDITAGELRIDGVVVNDFEPKDRNIAMVFQNYALYPHMTVYDNMAFSLRTMHMPKDEVDRKVRAAAQSLGITEYLQRKPKALSGGQRQRVALGRAIVRDPKVFLLDEPLSNLDAKLRGAMRTEISLLHERLGTTFIYVTHDQVEAMTMGTRIVVMQSGYVRQIDTPINLYKYPANMFVAGFIGTPQMNFFDCVMLKYGDTVRFTLDCGVDIAVPYTKADKIPTKYMDGQYPAVFAVRPDDIRIGKYPDSPKIKAKVTVTEMLGSETVVYANLDLDDPTNKKGRITVKTEADCAVGRGDIIDISVNPDKFHVFDKESEINLKSRIPDTNHIVCDTENGHIVIQGERFPLPPAIKTPNGRNIELTVPVSALKTGKGIGTAEVRRVEVMEKTVLYTLGVGELTVFASEQGEARYKQGDKIAYDIDMRYIGIKEYGITPLCMQNTLHGEFVKQKISGKKYDFYLRISGQMLKASDELSKKLFACCGTKIFRKPLQYIFAASDCRIVAEPYQNSLSGTVTDISDYGVKKYATVSVHGQNIIAEYDGLIGDKVFVQIDVSSISVKDTDLDITIS